VSAAEEKLGFHHKPIVLDENGKYRTEVFTGDVNPEPFRIKLQCTSTMLLKRW
jgi:hypothetical protein